MSSFPTRDNRCGMAAAPLTRTNPAELRGWGVWGGRQLEMMCDVANEFTAAKSHCTNDSAASLTVEIWCTPHRDQIRQSRDTR